MKQGKLIILSAPSGSGKTTLVKYLLKTIDSLVFSVSCTTRLARPNEMHGKDYYFISEDEFNQHVEKGDFVEWEQVYETTKYGTLKSEMERIWAMGKHVVFDIDVKGGMALKKRFNMHALSIFIEAPSIAILKQRLRLRSTESEEKLNMRIAKAQKEMEEAPLFDTILINDDLDAAKASLTKIVQDFLNGGSPKKI